MITVVSENKLSQTNYTVIINAKNSEASIVDYSVANQVGASVIDPVLQTVKVFINNNANNNALVPIAKISDFATLRIGTYFQINGVTTLNYTLPIVYNVTAQDGAVKNWTITIEKAKPIITLLGDAVVSVDKGYTYKDAGFIAKDNLDFDITSEVIISGTVDVNMVGKYILTYTVKDAYQNESSVTRIINVVNTGNLGVAGNSIEGFLIYPNPVSDGKLFVQTTSDSFKNVRIFDMSGKNVLSILTKKNDIDVSGLSTGVYIVKVEQDKKESEQKLIIK